VPSRARLALGSVGVDEQPVVDGVADVALEGADGVLLGLAFGELAFEVRAALGMRLADLADRGEVQGVVEASVATLGAPVHDPAPGGTFDRGGAVVGRVGVTADEPADVAGEADQIAGDDRPDAEQLGQAGLRGGDRGADPAMGVLELFVEALHVAEQLGGEVMAGLFDRSGWLDTLEESDGVRGVEFLGDSAW
jgi:hypothetical protein